MLKSIYLMFTAFLLTCEASATNPPHATSTSNQQLIADQLENITQPTHGQADFLAKLSGLDEQVTQKVLNQMSGQQFTTLFISTEITNRQFIRRLYDPLRPIISNPDSYEDEVYDLCSSKGVNAWAESSVNRSFLNGNKNTHGFKMSGYEISVGAQKRLTSCWTLGAGGCYAIDHFHYNVGGSGKTNTVFGGVYTLYRPACYYVLADVTFGFATNDMHRRVSFNTEKNLIPNKDAENKDSENKDSGNEELKTQLNSYILQSRPNISQVSFYGEAGFDWDYRCVLIQPFIGFEASHFKRKCRVEHGHPVLRLIYSKKDVTNAYSRLGVHLTIPENCYDLTMAFDLAWQYRLTSSRNSLVVKFAEFGTPFDITGIPDERNSLSMGFCVWSEILEGWTMYLEASGERWKRVSNYEFTGGLIFKW